MKQKSRNYNIIVFILYAFSIPTICIVSMKYIPACKQGVLQLILYGIEAASPSLAAIMVVLQREGASGLKESIIDKYKNGISFKLCLFGFLAPAMILTVAKLVTYLTPYNNEFITMPNSKKMITLFWALIAEELGWRGYLQNEIEHKCGSKITPFIVGVIWALWHYHFLLSGTMDIPIILFTYGCIAESYGYYVITKLSNGNIIPASLWHFTGNLFFNLYLLNPNWNGGSIVPYIIVNLLYVSYIIIFICFRKRKDYAK